MDSGTAAACDGLHASCKRLKSASEYVGLVSTSLNFASAKMQGLVQAQLDVQPLEHALQELAALQDHEIAELKDYYAGDFTPHFSAYVVGKELDQLSKIFCEYLPQLRQKIADHPLEQFFNPHLATTFARVLSIFLDSNGGLRKSIFKKANKACNEEQQQAFFDHPVLRSIKAVVDAKLAFESQIDLVDSHLKFYLAQQVKQRLPQHLQQKGETTFA